VTQTLVLSTNQVGSVQLVTDADTGDEVQRIAYDEFGRVLSDSAPGSQPFGFAGGLYDAETKLVRFGARDYASDVGRWIARDPVRFLGGLNALAYAHNNPINARDFSGLWRSPFEIADEAESTAKNSGLSGRVGGDQDAYRHCLASCEISKEYSEDIAEALGDLHEFSGDICGQSQTERQMDDDNNSAGRELSRSSTNCSTSCRDALDNGNLVTLPPGSFGGTGIYAN
jgi:RHS repeat-associated protein